MLGLATGIVGNDRIGGVEDVLSRSVVLFQQDDLGVGVITLELDDVADVGAAKGVDALVRIANHAQIAMLLGEQLHEHVLGVIRVLVLVHEDVTEAVLVEAEDVGEGCKQFDRDLEKVIEIHGRRFQQALLIEPIDLGNLLVKVSAPLGSESLMID